MRLLVLAALSLVAAPLAAQDESSIPAMVRRATDHFLLDWLAANGR